MMWFKCDSTFKDIRHLSIAVTAQTVAIVCLTIVVLFK